MTTPNMNLTLPTDHGSADVWDTILDEVFGTIDSHDHTSGKGVAIPSAALDINADVPWSSGGDFYAITGLKAIDFEPSTAADVAGYAGALFLNSADDELYYRTTSGSNVKVTDGVSLNVSAFTGGIGGDYSAVGALLSFDDASDSYWFQQQGSPRPWAGARLGNLDIYEQAVSIANRVRLQSPSGLAASYAVTFPAAVPGTQQLLQMAANGALLATNTIAEDVTLDSGKNIELQGTGYVQHGDRVLVVPFVYPNFVLASGTINNNGASLGCAMAVSSAGYFPLTGLPNGARVKSVQVLLGNNPGAAITYDFYLGSVSIAVFSWTLLTSSSSALAAPTLTPSGGILMQGDPLFLKVTTPGGSTATLLWARITYDTP